MNYNFFTIVLEEIKNFILKGHIKVQKLKKIEAFLNIIQKKITYFYEKQYINQYELNLHSLKSFSKEFHNFVSVNSSFFSLKNNLLAKNFKLNRRRLKKFENATNFFKEKNFFARKKYPEIWINFLKKKKLCIFDLFIFKKKILIKPSKKKYFFNEKYKTDLCKYPKKSENEDASLFLLKLNNTFRQFRQIKKFFFCKKNSRFSKNLFLKISYFLSKKKLKYKWIYLNGYFLNEKEIINKNFTNQCFFFPEKKNIFIEKTLYTSYNIKTHTKKKKFREKPLLQRNSGYFLLNSKNLKENISILSFKKIGFKFILLLISIIYLWSFLLFGQKIKFFPDIWPVKQGFSFLTKILIKKLEKMCFKDIKNVEFYRIKMLIKFLNVISQFNKFYYTTYFQTLLHHIGEIYYMKLVCSKMNIILTNRIFSTFKSTFNYIGISLKANTNGKISEQINFIPCQLCLMNYVIRVFLGNISLEKEKLCDFHMASYSNLVFGLFQSNIQNLKFITDIIDYNYRKIVTINLATLTPKTFYLFFQKFLRQKIITNSIEIKFLIELLEKRKNFQDKFLFMFFLKIRKFYEKLSIDNYGLYKKKIQKPFFNISLVFLFNFIYDFSTNTNNFIEKINKEQINLVKEIITIIGPNRDFFSLDIKNFYLLKKNLMAWGTKIFYLYHFSRMKKIVFLKNLLFKRIFAKNILNFTEIPTLANKLNFKTLDNKFIQCCLLFEFIIKQKNSVQVKFLSNQSFLQQINISPELFYDKFVYQLKNNNKNKFYFHEDKKKIPITKLDLPIFIKFKEKLLRDKFDIDFYSKNLIEKIKVCQFIENLRNLSIKFSLELLNIMFREKNSSDGLFVYICLYNLLVPFLMKKKFKKALIYLLKVFIIIIKKRIVFLPKKLLSTGVYCHFDFLKLLLLRKLKYFVKKKVKINQKEILTSSEEDLKIKMETIFDLSEQSFLKSDRTLKRSRL